MRTTKKIDEIEENKDFTAELAAMLPKERVERAKREAEEEMLTIQR
ncbi:MAG: hypothetical protein PVH61_07625 [Candidatus Aminicenantes bacterium]|jgi:hypothetical protein